MIFKQSAMVTILFFKMMPKFFTGKHLQARTSHGLLLHSEVIGAIIREISGHFIIMTPFDPEVGSKVKFNTWKRFSGHDFL